MRQPARRRHGFAKRHIARIAPEWNVYAHETQCRPHEDLEGHHRRDRIARQTEPWTRAQHAETERSARSHAYAPEIQTRAKSLHNIARVVERADADAAARDEYVKLRCTRDPFGNRDRIVRCDTERDRYAPGILHGGCECIAIRIDDTSAGEHFVELVNVHQLIAGRENRDARLPDHQQRAPTVRRRQCNVRGTQHSSVEHQAVTGAEVLTTRPDVARRIAIVVNRDAFKPRVGVLNTNHGVDVLRHLCARHDAPCAARRNHRRCRVAGGDGATHRKRDR